MLKEAITLAGISVRVARPLHANDLTVFTAYMPYGLTESAASELISLGLEYRVQGKLILLQPALPLVRALDALSRNEPSSLSEAVMRIYPQPGRLCMENRALLYEFSHLLNGIEQKDMPLFSRGIRLTECPSTRDERVQYLNDVRKAAALSLRLKHPGGTLRACAYLIATGGITYEA